MRLDIGYEYRSIFVDRRREYQMLTPRGSIWVSMLSDMLSSASSPLLLA